MIMVADIAALWLAACPSFSSEYAASCSDYGEDLLYVHAGAFARHLLTLHQAGQQGEFPAVATLIERLHVEGAPAVREFATIGILEGIQNVWGNNGVTPEAFLPFLLPASAEAWHDLNRFWNGESPFVPDRSRR